MKSSFNLPGIGLLAVWMALVSPAGAHPLGSFTIDRYARLQVTREAVRLRYILDIAEIPAFDEIPRVDSNGDYHVSMAEKRAYLQRRVRELAGRLIVQVNGKPLAWQTEASDLTGVPIGSPLTDAAPTLRLVADLRAALPKELSAENRVDYEDRNYTERTGWKEVVVQAEERVHLLNSSVPLQDRTAELTRFPSDAAVIPPQDTTATFTFTLGTAGENEAASVPSVGSTTRTSTSDRWFLGISGSVVLTLLVLLARYHSRHRAR
ncbi:MAG: hypothetical protein HY320_02620 [Armatimonadetes bacterium]|nr:hypothetical protein [Armatimonadota bacterium]